MSSLNYSQRSHFVYFNPLARSRSLLSSEPSNHSTTHPAGFKFPVRGFVVFGVAETTASYRPQYSIPPKIREIQRTNILPEMIHPQTHRLYIRRRSGTRYRSCNWSSITISRRRRRTRHRSCNWSSITIPRSRRELQSSYITSPNYIILPGLQTHKSSSHNKDQHKQSTTNGFLHFLSSKMKFQLVTTGFKFPGGDLLCSEG